MHLQMYFKYQIFKLKIIDFIGKVFLFVHRNNILGEIFFERPAPPWINHFDQIPYKFWTVIIRSNSTNEKNQSWFNINVSFLKTFVSLWYNTIHSWYTPIIIYNWKVHIRRITHFYIFLNMDKQLICVFVDFSVSFPNYWNYVIVWNFFGELCLSTPPPTMGYQGGGSINEFTL